MIAAGTLGEAAAKERLAAVEADEAQTRETHEAATRRAHALADELQVARTALTAADTDLAANQVEMTRLLAALDAERREAHRAAGRAEIARIEAEIAAGEERVQAAEAALAEAQAAVEATRARVAEQLRPHADIAGEWQHLLPRQTSLSVRALRAHVAYLEALKAIAEDGHSAVWLVRNQDVAGVRGRRSGRAAGCACTCGGGETRGASAGTVKPSQLWCRRLGRIGRPC
jgi:chromosome segregation ATPase